MAFDDDKDRDIGIKTALVDSGMVDQHNYKFANVETPDITDDYDEEENKDDDDKDGDKNKGNSLKDLNDTDDIDVTIKWVMNLI